MIGVIGIPKEYGRYMHQCTYPMHICRYFCMLLLCLPLPQPPYKKGSLLYMVAWEAASIAKTYRSIFKCELNIYICIYIYIDACTSHIPLEFLSSQSFHSQFQACYLRICIFTQSRCYEDKKGKVLHEKVLLHIYSKQVLRG